jgi:hypothetical protein
LASSSMVVIKPTGPSGCRNSGDGLSLKCPFDEALSARA